MENPRQRDANVIKDSQEIETDTIQWVTVDQIKDKKKSLKKKIKMSKKIEKFTMARAEKGIKDKKRKIIVGTEGSSLEIEMESIENDKEL